MLHAYVGDSLSPADVHHRHMLLAAPVQALGLHHADCVYGLVVVERPAALEVSLGLAVQAGSVLDVSHQAILVDGRSRVHHGRALFVRLARPALAPLHLGQDGEASLSTGRRLPGDGPLGRGWRADWRPLATGCTAGHHHDNHDGA